LTEIHLQAKQLTSSNDNFLAFARSLKNNTAVKILHLENNQITDDVIEIIAENSHIEAIYLNNNQITAKAVLALSKMKSLKILSLNGNSIGQEGFQTLANSSIEVVHVRSTGITASGLNALIANTHIKAIFAGNSLIDCVQLNVSLIEAASHLEFLELSACQLSNSDLHIILKLPNLLGLDVSVNHLTDPCIKELTTHPSLKVLSVGGNTLSETTIETLIVSQLYRVNAFSGELSEECITRMEQKNEGQRFTSWQTYEVTCEYKMKHECTTLCSNIN
jgi:Leucine-rich repeat (LRR) protein